MLYGKDMKDLWLYYEFYVNVLECGVCLIYYFINVMLVWIGLEIYIKILIMLLKYFVCWVSLILGSLVIFWLGW